MLKKIKKSDITVNIILIVLSVMVLFPVYIILLNSFKTKGEMLNSILSLPTTFTFDNYISTFGKLKYVSRVINTLFITVFSVLGIVFCSALAGYKIARTESKLSKLLFMFFTSSMLIPFHSIMISLTQVSAKLGIRDTKTGLVFIYIGLGINMAVFLFNGFAKIVPYELEEAAAIDGCNSFQTFFLIVFPMLKPIATTVAIIDILWIWNDFLLPLLMLNNQDNYTLILGINQFFGQYNTDWTNILAGIVLTSIPIIIFYLFFQKNIMKGIADGAVKG